MHTTHIRNNVYSIIHLKYVQCKCVNVYVYIATHQFPPPVVAPGSSRLCIKSLGNAMQNCRAKALSVAA